MIQKKGNDEEFTKKKLLIFDTNIFLTGIDFNLLKGIIYTPQKVIEEITVNRYLEKNRNIINRIQAALDSKKLILKAPSDKNLKKIEDRSKLSGDYNVLSDTDMSIYNSQYGHCQFFNRWSYIEGGKENEGFIAYAPEDQERGYRFNKLGYNVEWSDDYVYHLEHTRGPNSSLDNPMMAQNDDLFTYIKSLSKEQLIEYYKKLNII